MYKQYERDILDYLSKQKHFINYLQRGKVNFSKSTLTNDFFFFLRILKVLLSAAYVDVYTDISYDSANTKAVYNESDKEITCEEIIKDITNSKYSKSCSEDYTILNVMTYCCPCYISYLTKY